MKRKGVVEYDFWTMPEGLKLKDSYRRASRTTLPAGCGVAALSNEHLQSLRDLCAKIIDEMPSMVPWGDGWVDNKKRGYAMFPEQSLWSSVKQITDAGIVLHDVDSSYSHDRKVQKAAVRKHQLTVTKSFISVSPTVDEVAALRMVVELAGEIVNQHRDTLQPYEAESVSMENLVAIQPNVHNGDDYLPLHLDNPRHDGFGVVIVTVALWGTADIVLADDGDPEPHTDAGPKTVKDVDAAEPPAAEGDSSQSWSFTLRPGELYVLSGHARNKCAHGVVVLPGGPAAGRSGSARQRGRSGGGGAEGSTTPTLGTEKGKDKDKEQERASRWGRVSLNVRFGLHTEEQAHRDIDSHWA